LAADRQELDGGQPDGVGFGADQVVAWGEVVGGQRPLDAVGEGPGPAVTPLAGEAFQLSARGGGERGPGWPAFQEPQHGRGAQVVAGDLQGGRVGGQQVLAEPVE
jgi:hypothetical protein